MNAEIGILNKEILRLKTEMFAIKDQLNDTGARLRYKRTAFKSLIVSYEKAEAELKELRKAVAGHFECHKRLVWENEFGIVGDRDKALSDAKHAEQQLRGMIRGRR